MKPLISVILPIYRVENYLPKCIDSVLNQTYDNLEIILVDDGSTDNCGKMCDEYAKKDSRIKVIHKQNGGLSDARNAGLKEATGEYISYIDSDDYISVNFFDYLLKIMNEYNCDIVECGVKKVYDKDDSDNSIWKDAPDDETLRCFDKTESVVEIPKGGAVTSFSATDALSELINDGEFHQHVWNKLYKAEIVKNLLFEKGKCNEDEFWTYKTFGNSQRVAKYNKEMYFYRQREGSIMGSGYSLKRLDALDAKKERQEYIDKKFPKLSFEARKNYYFSCMYAYKASLKWLSKTDKAVALKKIRQHMKNQYKALSKDASYIKGKEKVRFFLSRNDFTFLLMCKAETLFGIGF